VRKLGYNGSCSINKRFLSMARPGGNPDFGTKYKANYGRLYPLSEQVKAQVYPDVKEKLKKLAEEKNCTVPDLVRMAIDSFLSKEELRSCIKPKSY
jgi:hypothetical protein